MGKNGNSDRLFSRAPKSLWMVKFHCSHEIKRSLLFGRKAMIHLHSTLKSRDITLLTNFHMVKAMVFPVVMYGCESWTIKECWRIYAFKLWCWKRRLRVFGQNWKPENLWPLIFCTEHEELFETSTQVLMESLQMRLIFLLAAAVRIRKNIQKLPLLLLVTLFSLCCCQRDR